MINMNIKNINENSKKKIKYIAIYYAIVLVYVLSKKILSIYNIAYRSWISNIMSVAMIIGISATVIFLIFKFNIKFFKIHDSAKNYIIIVAIIAYVVIIDFCFIIKPIAGVLFFLPLLFLKKSKILYLFDTVVIALLLRVFFIYGLYLLSHHFVEKPYDYNYIEVVDNIGNTNGLYKPLNIMFRRRITVDYGMEELLEYRYGIKFEIQREGNQVYFIPETYPQLKLKLCSPYYGVLDFTESLARWYFEKAYKEQDMKMDYIYMPGYWLVANDIFCPIIDETGDFDLYAEEISEMIKCANADPYFRSNQGTLKCVIMFNGNIEDYVYFHFGSEKNGKNGDYYEKPENVLGEIKKYHIGFW